MRKREVYIRLYKIGKVDIEQILWFINFTGVNPTGMYCDGNFSNRKIKFNEKKINQDIYAFYDKKNSMDLTIYNGDDLFFSISNLGKDGFVVSIYIYTEYFLKMKNEIIKKFDELFTSNQGYYAGYIEDAGYSKDATGELIYSDDLYPFENIYKNISLIYLVEELFPNYESFLVDSKKYKKYVRNENKYSVSFYEECMPNHYHSVYKHPLGCSWMMWFTASYKEILDFDKLKNYRNCYENIDFGNDIIRIRMYENIIDFDTKENVDRMWNFRKELKVDEIGHIMDKPFPDEEYEFKESFIDRIFKRRE